MAVSPDLRAVEDAYRAGTARLGIALAYLSLKNWGQVSARTATTTGGAWLDGTLRLIQAVRWQSKRLSIAYYQLARAIETGRTLGLPSYTDNPAEVSLDGLRTQMVDVLREIDALGFGDLSTDNPDYNWLASELKNADLDGRDQNARSVRFSETDIEEYIEAVLRDAGDDREVVVDTFTWPADLTREQIDRAFKNILTEEALKAHDKKVKGILNREGLTPEEALNLMDSEHELSGSRGAGIADWAAIDAGRSVVEYASRYDYKSAAYCRLCGPRPCAWCSMLASRGFVYSSAESAGNLRQWHPNCHCTVAVRWSSTSDEDLPPSNRYYKSMWPGVTEKARGADKLRVWRQWLAKEQRASN